MAPAVCAFGAKKNLVEQEGCEPETERDVSLLLVEEFV